MKNHLSTFKNFFDLKKIYTLIFITLALWSIFAYNTITNLIQSQKIYAEIIEELTKKNPDMMIGYSFENLNNYNKIKNQNKKS